MKSVDFGEIFGKLSPKSYRPTAVVGGLRNVLSQNDLKKPSPLYAKQVSIVMESALPDTIAPKLVNDVLNYLSPVQRPIIGLSGESATNIQERLGFSDDQIMLVVGAKGLDAALKKQLSDLKGHNNHKGTRPNNMSFVSGSLDEIHVANRLGIPTLLNLETMTAKDKERFARLGASALSRRRNQLPEPPKGVVSYKDWIKKGKKPESTDAIGKNSFLPDWLTPRGVWKELNFIKRAVRNYKRTQG